MPRRIRDKERGDGEDCARGNRFPYGADGAGEVLLKDGASHDAQERHADHCRRVCRGNRHTRFQPKVGVCRPEDYRTDPPDDQSPKGELLQIRLGWNERLVATARLLATLDICHTCSIDMVILARTEYADRGPTLRSASGRQA